MKIKIIAFILAKLSHIFPNHVYVVVDNEMHMNFYFYFFGLKILKGQFNP